MNRQRGFILGLQGAALYLVVGLAIALAASWAASGLAIWYLDGKVETAQKAAKTAAEALGKETTSRQTFQAQAQACGESVAALEAKAEQQEQAHRKSLVASKAKTATAEKVIQEILTTPRPAGSTECQATLKELDDEIDRRNPRP